VRKTAIRSFRFSDLFYFLDFLSTSSASSCPEAGKAKPDKKAETDMAIKVFFTLTKFM